MNIIDRFIGYTRIDTTSNENDKIPSSENQLILANKIKNELLELGINDAIVTDNCFVYATIQSNTNHQTPVFGLLAHMDTSNATSGKDIKTRVIRNYDGKDIKLSEGIYSTVEDYPVLKKLSGMDLIVTDGTTLLGGDDKAGIAIIMDMVQKLKENPEIKHGEIKIAFTPDEEIGEGIHHIDLSKFVCEYAYTLDGGNIEDVTYENFNAATAVVKFYGNSIHPGDAKNKMINASQLAMEFNSMLPVNERPEYTCGREGFNHLLSIEGTCQQANSVYIIRNHDKDLLHKQMRDFELITMHMNEIYRKQVVELDMKETYSNMKECFDGKMFIIDDVMDILKSKGYNPFSSPIRGGTDGAALSFMGIPTPNLGTGDYNCHGNHEFVCINEMNEMVQVLLELVQVIEKKEKQNDYSV